MKLSPLNIFFFYIMVYIYIYIYIYIYTHTHINARMVCDIINIGEAVGTRDRPEVIVNATNCFRLYNTCKCT